jgi:hypothetical protein
MRAASDDVMLGRAVITLAGAIDVNVPQVSEPLTLDATNHACASVIIEEPSETRTAVIRLPPTSTSAVPSISPDLVIALPIIVLDDFADDRPQGALPDRNHSVEAVVLDGAHEPVRVGVRVDA